MRTVTSYKRLKINNEVTIEDSVFDRCLISADTS